MRSWNLAFFTFFYSLNRPSVMAVLSSHMSSPVKCSSAERSTTFVTAVQMDLTVLSTECARENRNIHDSCANEFDSPVHRMCKKIKSQQQLSKQTHLSYIHRMCMRENTLIIVLSLTSMKHLCSTVI